VPDSNGSPGRTCQWSNTHCGNACPPVLLRRSAVKPGTGDTGFKCLYYHVNIWSNGNTLHKKPISFLNLRLYMQLNQRKGIYFDAHCTFTWIYRHVQDMPIMLKAMVITSLLLHKHKGLPKVVLLPSASDTEWFHKLYRLLHLTNKSTSQPVHNVSTYYDNFS
jgi:hypothetical protein